MHVDLLQNRTRDPESCDSPKTLSRALRLTSPAVTAPEEAQRYLSVMFSLIPVSHAGHVRPQK